MDDISLITQLIQAKIEYQEELEQIQSTMEQILNEVNRIDVRLASIEMVVVSSKKKTRRILEATSRFYELARTYWHLAFILASTIIYIAGYIHGIKIREDFL